MKGLASRYIGKLLIYIEKDFAVKGLTLASNSV